MKQNWNVRTSYSYVATATKIRFHFHFPRSPDAAFCGLYGRLFNWKCNFSRRIISNIANDLKYNYFEMVTASIMSRCYFEYLTHCRRRGWWYHVPQSSLCVCGCLCLSRCLSGRFIYEGLVPHKQYFAGTLLGIPSCASYVSRTHDVIDDVTKSQSRSNSEINISPSIFELERRSKLKMSEMLMAIFLVYSTSGITSGKKVCRYLKMAAIWNILKYQTQLQFDLRYEKIVQNYAKKSIFMMMTSAMTS